MQLINWQLIDFDSNEGIPDIGADVALWRDGEVVKTSFNKFKQAKNYCENNKFTHWMLFENLKPKPPEGMIFNTVT